MMTAAMKAELRARGYTDAQIADMRPADAWQILNAAAATEPRPSPPLHPEQEKPQPDQPLTDDDCIADPAARRVIAATFEKMRDELILFSASVSLTFSALLSPLASASCLINSARFCSASNRSSSNVSLWAFRRFRARSYCVSFRILFCVSRASGPRASPLERCSVSQEF